MEYESDARMFNFLSGLVCGTAIGVGVALMMAPQSGRKTRKKLHRAAEDLRDNATERWEEVAEEVRDRMDEALASARKRIP